MKNYFVSFDKPPINKHFDMKKIYILLCLPLLLIFMHCDKEDKYIKQLRIDLGSCPQTDYRCMCSGIYKDFNIKNYPGIKSIIFTAKLSTSHPENTCSLVLYNLTDSIRIDSSAITTRSVDPVWLESDNLLEFFPDHDIDLSLHLSTEYMGLWVYAHAAYLYLYME